MIKFTATQRKNLVIAVAVLLVIGFSTWLSLDPENYFYYHREDRKHWRHPTVPFLMLCLVYLAEAVFIAIAIKFDAITRLWPRTLLATLLFLPWVSFSSMFVMHAPRFLHAHVVWTWLLLAVLVLVTLGSAAKHLLTRSTPTQSRR